MRKWFNGSITRIAFIVLITAAVTASIVLSVQRPTSGQARTYRAPRTTDGKPNLNGIWQALTTANWDVQDHAAQPGQVVATGALGAIPAGLGIVEGGEIPYTSAALAKKKENFDNRLLRDPAIKCYMPGLPRATYMPFPFQIVQTPTDILISYEFASAARTIFMNSKEEAPAASWMGWSRGHWEGETLVVEVTAQNDQTWFDSAGNHHTEALRVVERYTATGPDHLLYEATIEDPKTFTRPWKISLPLYRRVEKSMQLLDFKCVEFVEELLYGHLRKGATN